MPRIAPSAATIRLAVCVGALALAAAAHPAAAADLTFDTLHDKTTVPNGYGGLDWSGAGVVAPVMDGLNNGLANALVSSPNVIDNVGGGLLSITSPTPFSVLTFDLTAALNDNLQVTIGATFTNPTVAFHEVVNASTTGPQLITLGLADVTGLFISASGGTPHAGFTGGSASTFGIDDLVVIGPGVVDPAAVPEPGALVLMGTALLGLGLLGRMRCFSAR